MAGLERHLRMFLPCYRLTELIAYALCTKASRCNDFGYFEDEMRATEQRQRSRHARLLSIAAIFKEFKASVLLWLFAMVVGSPVLANTIVAIPTKDGIAVVADKRVVYKNGVGIDIGNKIHQMGKYGLVISTGTSVAFTSEDDTSEHLVDAKELVKDYCWDRQVLESDSIYPHKEQIQDILLYQYSELFKKIKRSEWLNYCHGKTADETLVLRYNPTTKQFEGLRFEVLVNPDGGADSIQVNTNIIAASRFAYPKVILMGLDSYEVESGVAPYHSVQTEPWFEKTVTHPEKLGATEALDAGLKFIELVHENHPKEVGDTVDGVMITSDEGVMTRFSNASFAQARESMKEPEEKKAELRLDPLPEPFSSTQE